LPGRAAIVEHRAVRIDHRRQQLELAAEVVVEQRQRHLGVARDVSQAGPTEAVMGEMMVGREQDRVLALHAFLCWPCTSARSLLPGWRGLIPWWASFLARMLRPGL
jgi:hypothetical protein